jgi:maleylpyruvate isomerase
LKEQGVDHTAWAAGVIGKGLGGLEALASETAGMYTFGNEPTLADACLVPQLYNARRFGIDVADYPTLAAVEAACQELPAFKEAHPDVQPDADA